MEETIKQSVTTIEENAPSLDVTLPQLETEIKFHLNQINQNIIEIGKRLIVAKSLIPHGQWQTWLRNNFQLSQWSAIKFINCAERFGKLETNPILNQSQMVTLLSLPNVEETEKFIEQKESEGNPISKMSVKTLRKEIKQWKAETEKITPVQPPENKKVETLDITSNTSSQNQNDIEQSISNESDDTPLDNPEQQAYSEPQQTSSELQQPSNKSSYENNNPETTIFESPAEIPEIYLIEEISDMSNSLIQHENLNEVIQIFAKTHPDKSITTLQNLNIIVSKLQNALKSNN